VKVQRRSHETEQIRLWRGAFGNSYIDRNRPDREQLRSLTRMWARMIKPIHPPPTSIVEVGANIGLNLRALGRISDATLTAVEPNAAARRRLKSDKVVSNSRIVNAVAANLPLPDRSADLVFTCGVLIHIDPADLAAACKEIHRVSRRWILCAEYFSPEPRSIPYRGHKGQLFTRDFGRFWQARHSDLGLVDYGFFWRGAGATDDLNWWLFDKSLGRAARRGAER
jgi:pseudaminic acid biosynthesis-associated methylase